MSSEKNFPAPQGLSYNANADEASDPVEKGNILHNEQPGSPNAVLETKYAGK